MNPEKLLNEGLAECRIHIKRINYAKKRLNNIFPADLESWQNLSDDKVEAMDQLVFRFTKLQDALGLRVFSQLLAFLQEPVENRSMLDKINKLEKLGILPSVLKWQELRNLRNNLLHEYPGQTRENCERFNYFFKEVDSLIDIFSHLDNWLSGRLSE